MAIALENGKAYQNGRFRNSELFLEEIIQENGSVDSSIDCKGLWVLPGMIDVHVHFRVPGGEHKEDWKTGSLSAAMGGVTTVLDMPNTNPPTITVKELEEKRAVAERDSIVRYGFHFGATANNFEEALNAREINSIKIYMGSSTGNLLVSDEIAWKKWFQLCKEKEWTMVVHAEYEPFIIDNGKKYNENSVRVHNKIRDTEVESTAIEKALHLQKEIGNKLHIAHLSSKVGLELVEEAKKEREGVTCEVCPHHLFLDETILEKLGNFGKMNPPLRSKEDTSALWKGIKSGIIDCIATDHAPHTLEEKQRPYSEAPSGVPGVETMLPLLLNAVHEEKIDIQDLVRCCSENPSHIFGMQDRGTLESGKMADIVIVDPQQKWRITGKELHSKCGWTPFEGFQVQGKVINTIVAGIVVTRG